MKKTKQVLLPGLTRQFRFLLKCIEIKNFDILVIGAGSVQIAKLLQNISGKNVDIIVEEYDSLINSKLLIAENKNLQVKLMDFERTDYNDKTFDLVYAQGSISNFRRNKIVKEIKRILKPNGFLSVGEVIKLQENVPNFVNEIFEYSEINPLLLSGLVKFYEERKFEIIDKSDLSYTLKEYYSMNLNKLKTEEKNLTENEKVYYKKLLKKINHESNAYLKHGADKFMGFETLLLKKK